MLARSFLAKTLQVAGLVIVGMALLIGLRDDDMSRELLTLGFGSLVFVAGWLVEPGRR